MKQIAIVIAAAAVCGIASAQNMDLSPKSLSVRIGGVYPFETVTRAVTGNMFAVGVDFNSTFTLFKHSQGYVSLDWYAKGIKGKSDSIIPIMFNQRFMMTEAEDSEEQMARPYFFVGAGVANIDIFKSKLTYGVRGGIGADIGRNLFGELTLLITSDANGARGNSIGIFGGYRF